MRQLTIVGIGLAFFGLAMGIIAWLVRPETIPYGVRFGLILFAIFLFIAGLVLICGPFVFLKWFKQQLFCYFSLYRISGNQVLVNGAFQLAMTSSGVIEKVNYWISPWGAEPTGLPNDPYYSLDQQKLLIPIIHQGGFAWDRVLPLGNYRIDFTTKQGNWYEHLEIYLDNEQVKQRIRVTTEVGDRGNVLYSFVE